MTVSQSKKVAIIYEPTHGLRMVGKFSRDWVVVSQRLRNGALRRQVVVKGEKVRVRNRERYGVYKRGPSKSASTA